MMIGTVLVLCFCCTLVLVSGHDVNKEEMAQLLLESKVYRGIKNMDDAKIFLDALLLSFENYNFTEAQAPLEPFPCSATSRSPARPTNARRLKPGDIDLVVALGDSLTAAFGADATSFFNLFTDYRASSFSVGWSNRITTLPTSLLVFNPNLTGFSIGSGNANSANSRLNVAVSGARSADLPPQVDNLLTKLQQFPDRGMWKHVALFIGGNDLCDSCTDWETYSPERFEANVDAAVDSIQKNIPNVFLSLVGPPDITLLADLTGGWCGILKPFECSCTDDDGTSALHPGYMKALHNIEAKYNNRQIENFFVSVQPFFELINLPRLPDGRADMTYFAPDCFHFSAKAHSAAALALWNNLMETPADKRRYWEIGEPYECPTEDQYLQ